MRGFSHAALCAALIIACVPCSSAEARALPSQTTKEEQAQKLKPDVAALLKQSTEVYSKMKSYRHTARWSISAPTAEGELHEDLNFTLALERPNKFMYRLDTKSEIFPPVAAYSDGATFINFRSKVVPTAYKQYIKSKAPATYKGINIVDDVEFQPIGTYIIALMLQGDALADKDVRGAMEKSSLKPTVTENGKKWQVLEMPFGSEETPYLLYFGQDDHLIGKAVQKGTTKITEVIDAVKIDKPIENSVFQYTLPADAKQVEKFTTPQRFDDASRAFHGVKIAHR